MTMAEKAHSAKDKPKIFGEALSFRAMVLLFFREPLRRRRQPSRTWRTAVVGDDNARETGERPSSYSLGRSEEIPIFVLVMYNAKTERV